MNYIFDTGPFIILFRHFYRERFPTLWEKFDSLIEEKTISSVREVKRELEIRDDKLKLWTKENKGIFTSPSIEEFEFVNEIFKIRHFQSLIKEKNRMTERPQADPFVIAKAFKNSSCVVTTEIYKPNASKIPNICEFFNIGWTDL